MKTWVGIDLIRGEGGSGSRGTPASIVVLDLVYDMNFGGKNHVLLILVCAARTVTQKHRTSLEELVKQHVWRAARARSASYQGSFMTGLQDEKKERERERERLCEYFASSIMLWREYYHCTYPRFPLI